MRQLPWPYQPAVEAEEQNCDWFSRASTPELPDNEDEDFDPEDTSEEQKRRKKWKDPENLGEILFQATFDVKSHSLIQPTTLNGATR